MLCQKRSRLLNNDCDSNEAVMLKSKGMGDTMPTCENCHNKWSWKQTIRKMFTLDTTLICPYCGERQYQTRKSKKKASILNLLVLSPLLLDIFFDVSVAILLSLFPILFIIIVSFNPSLMHLSNKEEVIIPSEK